MGLLSRLKRRKEPLAVSLPPPAEPVEIKRLLSYRAANLQGMGSRQRQEDSFAFANVTDVTKMREKGLLAIVADGMGGMKDGKVASETAIQSIRSDFESFDYSEDLPVQLCNTLYKANEKVYALLDGEGGSTAVICLFYNEKLYFANIGDSYLMLKRNGQIYHLNRKHTVFRRDCAALIRNGKMDPSELRLDPERDALTQFLGMDEIGDIDCFKKPLKLENSDIVMLCSDGVGGVLSEEEINCCLNKSCPEAMCTALEQSVIAKGRQHQDNYTALIIQCEY
ncbi:MAG: PP2C family protein-serine/threonine phosphatase [Acutalibacteraceae bacterium]